MLATIWLGPVYSGQVAGAVYPGSHLYVVQVANAAQAAPLLAKWTRQDGRILPLMLASLGIDEASLEGLFIGSFSAGHNIAKKLTLDPSDCARINALMLADSSQSAWADSGHSRGLAPQGYVNYGALAASSREHLLCATSSTLTDGTYAGSSQAMWSVEDAVAANVGAAFEGLSPLVPPSLAPPPQSIQALGNCLLLDYGQSIAHAAHVLSLAPEVWAGVLEPWWSGGGGNLRIDPGPPEPPPNPPGPPATARSSGGLGAALGLIVLGGLTAAGYAYGRRG